jgi:hypothetical protein
MTHEETRGNVRNGLSRDLKSLDGNVVWVRVPPPAPLPHEAFARESSAIPADKTPLERLTDPVEIGCRLVTATRSRAAASRWHTPTGCAIIAAFIRPTRKPASFGKTEGHHDHQCEVLCQRGRRPDCMAAGSMARRLDRLPARAPRSVACKCNQRELIYPKQSEGRRTRCAHSVADVLASTIGERER